MGLSADPLRWMNVIAPGRGAATPSALALLV